jgi:hypothetical protein
LPPAVVDDPTTKLMPPPAPAVASPVVNDTQPVLPDSDVPVLNSTLPELPFDAASALATDTEPEPELVLPPLRMNTGPLTDFVTDEPDDSVTPPAVPLRALPTIKLMAPDLCSDAPDDSATKPVLPLALAPVLMIRLPDAPADSTLAVHTTTDPDDELTLLPLDTCSAPPTGPLVDVPPDSTTAPPARNGADVPALEPPVITMVRTTPESPEPTTTLTLPPRPLVIKPARTCSQPVLPVRDVPELSSTLPLEPNDATAADAITTEPEPELTGDPLLTSTEPPRPTPAELPPLNTSPPPAVAAADDEPAFMTTAVVAPELLVPTSKLTEPEVVPEPGSNDSQPVLPDSDQPVLSSIAPDAMLFDADAAVEILMEPEAELLLSPPSSEMDTPREFA